MYLQINDKISVLELVVMVEVVIEGGGGTVCWIEVKVAVLCAHQYIIVN